MSCEHCYENVEQVKALLKDLVEAWEYFSEYNVPIGMKEEIEKLLLKL